MPAATPNRLFADKAPPAKLRRRGSRSQLASKFFADVYAAWEEQGESVIARAAFHDPVAFMQMVARLMPQKIEVTTPTDGLSDERLAELLDLAERMAELRAEEAKTITLDAVPAAAAPLALAHNLTDENALRLDGAQEGGGGPVRERVVGGENTTSTCRSAENPPSETVHNPLNSSESNGATTDDAQADSLPYPVGPAQPRSAVEIAKMNRAKLISVPDEAVQTLIPVDPASLF